MLAEFGGKGERYKNRHDPEPTLGKLKKMECNPILEKDAGKPKK